jgi:RNA polymerase sigma-70 factor (ECF subfamily)
MELDDFLGEVDRQLAQRWPQLGPVDRAGLLGHLESLGVREELAQLRAADLTLAWLCCRGHVGALAVFEREYISRLPERLRRIDGSPAFIGEMMQRVRERLLVPVDGRIRLAEYAGRGSLLSWTQVAATRLALNHRRDEKPDRHLNADDVDLVGVTDDPVMELLKRRHAADFKEVLTQALDALGEAERELLRLHFVDALTLGQIGQIEGVDKSTVSRRLAAIHETLLDRTREGLKARLGVSHSELDSLMTVVQSRLSLSLERLLRR